jgi:hypothetical protein
VRHAAWREMGIDLAYFHCALRSKPHKLRSNDKSKCALGRLHGRFGSLATLDKNIFR